MSETDSRRDFMGRVLKVASLGAAAAVATPSAKANEGDRRVIQTSRDYPFSAAVVLDKHVYVSGALGRDRETGELDRAFEPQCRQAFENLKQSVEAAGSSMKRVLKCTCYLIDVQDFQAMNRVFRAVFPADPPARSTVVVKSLVAASARIEVDCVSALD
jgi:2-iminobutanoate/2-iminopropanoate deaminase